MNLPANKDLIVGSLFYHLFDKAEKSRWEMTGIRWEDIDHSKVTPILVKMVRQIAYSELTTFSATIKFNELFHDDADFTQWLSVWLYEETKHAQALMRWLSAAGESFDSEFILRGRETQPMLASRIKTLTMNILSEMTVSQAYLTLRNYAEEPVLKGILGHLSADEARHGSSFAAYLEKEIKNAPDLDRARLEVLEVLMYWTVSGMSVNHPAGLLYNIFKDHPEILPLVPRMGFNSEEVHKRICAVLGKLLDQSVQSTEEIIRAIGRMRESVARRGVGASPLPTVP